MKNGLLIWNLALTLGCGYLFFAHFTGKKPGASSKGASRDGQSGTAEKGAFKIAYFEMDSLAEIERMSKSLQQKFNYYQQQATSGALDQAQSEAASQEMKNLDNEIKNRKQTLDSEYSDFVMRRQNEIKTKIESFLKEYNKEKDYSYIVSYEQGLFYYRDTAYNITADVIKGLNASYKAKKN